MSEEKLNDFLLLGELALDGTLRPIHGALSIAVEAKKKEIKGIILPEVNAKEAAMAGRRIKNICQEFQVRY